MIAIFKDKNGIEWSVSFVDTFKTGEELEKFVNSILCTRDWYIE